MFTFLSFHASVLLLCVAAVASFVRTHILPGPHLRLLQLYMYQLFRSLAYIHSLGICHRDIKPQNLLLDPETAVLKLCDFGSAKQLLDGEPNVSYICSRYYRAPELIFGAINYTTKIGMFRSRGPRYARCALLNLSSLGFLRCVERWLRSSGTAARTTDLPWRFRCRSAGGNHQGSRHANPGTDQRNESQLHGVQIPTNQKSSMAKGTLRPVSTIIPCLQTSPRDYYEHGSRAHSRATPKKPSPPHYRPPC